MELISLKKPKLTEAQKKKQRDKEMSVDYEGDNYPYGTMSPSEYREYREK